MSEVRNKKEELGKKQIRHIPLFCLVLAVQMVTSIRVVAQTVFADIY
jgi:hypothetical protein